MWAITIAIVLIPPVSVRSTIAATEASLVGSVAIGRPVRVSTKSIAAISPGVPSDGGGSKDTGGAAYMIIRSGVVDNVQGIV